MHNISGLLGVALILLAYGLLQTDRLKPHKWPYSAINALGALLVLHSLYFDFNLAAFLLETVWLIISFIGLTRALGLRRGRKGNPKR